MTVQVVLRLGFHPAPHRLEERAEVDCNVDRVGFHLDVPVGTLPVELKRVAGPLGIDPELGFELLSDLAYSRPAVVEAEGVRAGDVDVSHVQGSFVEEKMQLRRRYGELSDPFVLHMSTRPTLHTL